MALLCVWGSYWCVNSLERNNQRFQCFQWNVVRCSERHGQRENYKSARDATWVQCVHWGVERRRGRCVFAVWRCVWRCKTNGCFMQNRPEPSGGLIHFPVVMQLNPSGAPTGSTHSSSHASCHALKQCTSVCVCVRVCCIWMELAVPTSRLTSVNNLLSSVERSTDSDIFAKWSFGCQTVLRTH